MDIESERRVTAALHLLACDLGMRDTIGGVRVTRIVVTELPPDDLTPEPWRVEWTNDLGEHRHTHHSKRAAQRHVANMLQQLQPDQTKDEVLTVHRRGGQSGS